MVTNEPQNDDEMQPLLDWYHACQYPLNQTISEAKTLLKDGNPNEAKQVLHNTLKEKKRSWSMEPYKWAENSDEFSNFIQHADLRWLEWGDNPDDAYFDFFAKVHVFLKQEYKQKQQTNDFKYDGELRNLGMQIRDALNDNETESNQSSDSQDSYTSSNANSSGGVAGMEL